MEGTECYIVERWDEELDYTFPLRVYRNHSDAIAFIDSILDDVVEMWRNKDLDLFRHVSANYFEYYESEMAVRHDAGRTLSMTLCRLF
jgi:hypothetical protein